MPDEAQRGFQYANKAFGIAVKSQKKEATTRKEVEAERESTVEQFCQLSMALQEAAKNFAEATTIMSQVGILHAKVVEL